MSGRLGDLSSQQQSALDELRTRIQDVATPRCDDGYLLRFLRARQFDLDKSEKKIRATLEFRKKWGADTILQDYTPPPLCVKYFPSGILPGPDKEGRPIPVLVLGEFDIKGLMKCHAKDELIRYKVYAMELLEQEFKVQTEKVGRIVDTVLAIVDMFGLSSYHLYRPGLVLFSEFMQIEEMHYPEIAGKVLLVRAPRIFPTIYALVKPFIDPNTKDKLEVLSGSNWKERLLENVSADYLPELYGGKLKKEQCPRVSWAGYVPKELYKENDVSLQHQFVKAGKKFTLEAQCHKANMELSWVFITENHDIAFAVYHQSENGELDEVVPGERVQAHHGNIEGTFVCEKPGVYVLEWDNSFSWTRGKNLRYKFELVEPGMPAQE